MNPSQLKESGESIRDKINLQFNVHRHIDRMSKIITDPNLDESRYNWAIEHLLTLLIPYGDDQFKTDIESIKKKYDEEIEKCPRTSEQTNLIKKKNREIFEKLSYLIKRLRMGLESEGSEDVGDEDIGE